MIKAITFKSYEIMPNKDYTSEHDAELIFRLEVKTIVEIKLFNEYRDNLSISLNYKQPFIGVG